MKNVFLHSGLPNSERYFNYDNSELVGKSLKCQYGERKGN